MQGVGRPKDEATAADGRCATEGIRLVERDIRCARLHEVQDAQTVRQDAIEGRVGGGVDCQRRRRTDDVVDNRRAIHWLEDGNERLVVASQVEGRRSRGTEGQRGGRVETVIRAQDEATSEGVEGRVITAPRDADVTITDDRVRGRVRNEGRVVDWSREREDADAANRAGEDAPAQVARRVVGSDGDGTADGRRVVLAQHRDGAGAGAARATADREVIGQRDAVIQEQAGGRAGLRINRDRASAQCARPRDDEVAPAEEGAARVGVRRQQVLRGGTELHERAGTGDGTAKRGGGQGEVRPDGQRIRTEVDRAVTRQEADVFAAAEVDGRTISDGEGEVRETIITRRGERARTDARATRDAAFAGKNEGAGASLRERTAADHDAREGEGGATDHVHGDVIRQRDTTREGEVVGADEIKVGEGNHIARDRQSGPAGIVDRTTRKVKGAITQRRRIAQVEQTGPLGQVTAERVGAR